MNNTKSRELIGEIGVDAGLCWVGDPCYILHKGENPYKDIGINWGEFCGKITEKDNHQFNYDHGHPGLGVVVHTGYGDGSYPVYIDRAEDGRIKSVTVEFISDEEFDDEEFDEEESED